MKILNIKFLVTFITISLSIITINSHSIFPGQKSEQEKACINKKNPSLAECKSVEAADEQEACCYVTYSDKETGETFGHCGYLENTEFGIKVYKHLYAGYKEIKILCGSNYIGRFLLIGFYIIFLFI